MPTDSELSTYLNDPVRDDRYGSLIAAGDNGEIHRLINEPGFGTVNRDTLSGAELFDAIELTEFSALDAAKQDRIKFLIQIGGQMAVGPNSKARAWLLDAFPDGTTTYDALVALVQRPGSEAEVQWGTGMVISLDQIRRAL